MLRRLPGPSPARVNEQAAWREAADRAYEQAQRYSWDRTLAPLLSMIEPDTPRA